MGHSRTLTGRWEIEPPLTFAEYRESEFAPEPLTAVRRPELTAFRFEVETEKRDTPEGVLNIHRAVAVVPRGDETRNWRVSTLHEELNRLWQLYGGLDDEVCHGLQGEFRLESDERQGDVQRWVADSRRGEYRHEEARLIWPDGSEVEP